MAVDADILDAAFTHLNNYATPLTIAWPNAPFDTPTDGSMWLEVSLFPNEPGDILWDSEVQTYLGFMQIMVGFRDGQGIAVATNEAEGLIAHFAKGTALGPVRVSQRPFIRSVVSEDNNTFHLPITIPYYGNT